MAVGAHMPAFGGEDVRPPRRLVHLGTHMADAAQQVGAVFRRVGGDAGGIGRLLRSDPLRGGG
jgi:hypothetical protein